jgi:hypothetical protein
VEIESISPQEQEKTEQIDSADLVVGILGEFDKEGIATLCGALRAMPGSPRIAILQDDRVANPAPIHPETTGSASLFLVPSLLAKPDGPGPRLLNMFAAYQSVFTASEKLEARACCVAASNFEAAAPGWLGQLAQPLLEGDLDLVMLHYARHRFEGLLNNSIIAPLTRSLYGKQIHNPLGPDLGVSRRLVQRVLGIMGNTKGGVHPLASLTPVALCDNLKVCEVRVGARIYPPTDWTNISSLIAQVLGPVFLGMERNAACWQRIRGSAPVAAIGEPVSASPDTGAVDISSMVESFQLGNRELHEIWGLVLPPATLFELRKLSRLPVEEFHMPDELWARIIYDFALAHRLRTISRDHLLKSLTPLYLGWVASYARDLQTLGAPALEQRLERLSLAYESGKPYLVSRWRWPDRFSP